VVLLDTRILVVDVQRRNYTVGDDAGTESAWCAGRASGIRLFPYKTDNPYKSTTGIADPQRMKRC
jgi:hypothetical protein